ncbi:MAG: DUF1501 domain-containing protein [Gemmataceae bacterium]
MFEASQSSATSGGLSRREFLRTSSLGAGAATLTLAGGLHAAQPRDLRCILLFLVGGPSQLDTWDLKPGAPSTVRGPFRPIRTSVPGVEIAETFPRMARLAQHYAVLRSLHHPEAPIHETGQQLLQTGRLCRGDHEQPHFGAVVSHLLGGSSSSPAFALVPGPIVNTGVSLSHGQGAGPLGARHEGAHVVPDLRALATDPRREAYGQTAFGDACLTARRLLDGGTRVAVVNMFTSVFDTITWDCHADGAALASSLDDYRDTLCPAFDTAYAALLQDLHDRGELDRTLVVALGEFGRTPFLNPRGGRDHWPGVWSALFAGGGIRGGQVIGSSDRLGGEPKDRPTSPAEVVATLYHLLGLDGGLLLEGSPLVEAAPIAELLA